MINTGHDKKKLWLTSPDDHHFISTHLTNKTIALWERKSGLFARADSRVTGAELAQRLPVCDRGGGLTGDVLPVHL